jgi:cell division protein FtsI (penicillin-binding protein 3)
VFIGMVPAEHPRLVGMVMIDDPQGSDYYGGLVAAPVFSKVMREGLRLLQVPPDEPTPNGSTETLALGAVPPA